jgi:integrase
MAAKGKAAEFPRTVKYGSGRVRIVRRSNGMFALSWREMGSTKQTTKATAAKALEFAEAKAMDLDAGDVRAWVSRGEGEILAAVNELAGTGEGAARRLVEDVRGAVKWLDGKADLTTAARWYAEHGPLKVERSTLGDAAARFLAEYDGGSKETRRTFGQEIDGFLDAAPMRRSMAVLDLREADLLAWCHRKVRGSESPAARTLANRITTWVTFLNRCRDWKMLPAGDHAADVLRKPTIPDAGKEIFTVDQGRRLLAAVRKDEPKLEVYLLIAGWLGLRPSEIQRLTWSAFDWDRGYLHVTPGVAQKTSSERFIPIDQRLAARLQALFLASGGKVGRRVCGFRSREFLSVLARKSGVCAVWPSDVLRHSFCSYRIAVCKSLPQVAEEAGNSPEILKSNYRRPLRHEDGLAWWGLLDEEGADSKE